MYVKPIINNNKKKIHVLACWRCHSVDHLMHHNNLDSKYFVTFSYTFLSEYEAQMKHLEESKAKFTEYEKQDVKCREDLKHSKQKAKKLEKQIEQEKKKVKTCSVVIGC